MDRGIFVCKSISEARNTTPYQRLQHLSSEFDLTVFTFDKIPPSLRDSCTVYQLPDSPFFKLCFPLWVAYHVLRRTTRDETFVYCSFHKPALLSGVLLHALGYTWIADIWDEPTLGMQLKKQKRRRSSDSLSTKGLLSYMYGVAAMKLIQPSLQRADLCVFVPDVYEEYGFAESDDNLLSIPNGVDFEYTIAEAPVERNAFTVFYVGSVQKARGALEILETAELLAERADEDIRFELVGPIPDEEAEWLQTEIQSRGLKQVVDVVGAVEHQEVLNRMANVDICLCILSPEIRNYRNTYPIKVFEYMAMGRPVICTDVPGTRNIIDGYENGILVTPEDSAAIVTAVERLMNDKKLRDEIGAKAATDARAYDWNQINARIIDQIHDLTATR